MKVTLLLLVIPFFLIGVVVIGLGRQEIIRLEREEPDLMRAVGIDRIDWWFGCLRGIFRLGFLSAGKVLPGGSRIKLQLVIALYVVAITHVTLWLLAN